MQNRKAQFEYLCPVNVKLMPKINGSYYCSNCEKKVHDLSGKSDLQILQQTSRFKSLECIHIEENRFKFLTRKIPKWKLLIVVVLNLKSFFFQKLQAQNLNDMPTNSPAAKKIAHTISGEVEDFTTGKAVKNPIVEVYADGYLIDKAEGSKRGQFKLQLYIEKTQLNSVSLKIYSATYAGSVIKKFPINKANTVLKLRIKKEGPVNEIKEIGESTFLSGNVRFLD